MTCKCDSPEGPFSENKSASNPIDIHTPAAPTSVGLSEVAISDGCQITVSGVHDTLNFPGLTLQAVAARIGGGTQVSGTVSGTSWSVSNVPGAKWHPNGFEQSVSVRADFLDPTGVIVPFTNSRNFISSSGPVECGDYYYSFTPPVGALGRQPMSEVMPRYFRVTAEFAGQQTFGRLAGGLLSSAPIYLAYDVTTSTPECPVWRDIGLPPGLGGWMLRVFHSKAGYEARLSIQTMTDTSIMPATILWTRNWSFRKQSLLHGSIEIGMSRHDVTLIVEPS